MQVINKTRTMSRKRGYKIVFPNSRFELKGFEVLLDSGIPTAAMKDNSYWITEAQYKLLKTKKIRFTIL